MNVINVVKALQDPVISNIINDHILERLLMNEISDIKTFQDIVASDYTKGIMQERKLINEINVIKLLHIIVISKYTYDHILERIPMFVLNMEIFCMSLYSANTSGNKYFRETL